MTLSYKAVLILGLLCGCLADDRKYDLPHFWTFEPSNNTFTKHYATVPSYARSLSPTFLTDPPTEIFHSHSQVSRQDMAVLTFFKDKPDGYFVDLAANDWQLWSNTYILEYYNNWKGICIEPNPKYLEGLVSNRKCLIMTSPVSRTNGETVKFRFHTSGGLSGIVGEEFDNKVAAETDVVLPTTTLTTLLNFAQAPRVMDYLSLDVEGAEHYVLQGLDPNKYTFLALTIERPKHHSHHLLSKYGYRFVYQMADFGECIYLHQKKEDFAALMTQFHQNTIPSWLRSEKHYMMYPNWNDTHYNATLGGALEFEVATSSH